MVLTPGELLLRARGGVIRTKWSDLAKVSIHERGRLSWLEGWQVQRVVTLMRREAASITLEEDYLGVPADVAAELCEAYARGAFFESGDDVGPS
jgi:hypothetical protein